MVQIYIGKGVSCHMHLFSSHFHGNMLAWTSVVSGRAAWPSSLAGSSGLSPGGAAGNSVQKCGLVSSGLERLLNLVL